MPITLDDLQTAIWVYNIKHYCIIWENQADLINEIENWVLNRAMNDLLMFKQIISQYITIAVNISGLHMSEHSLSHYVLSLLK
ncbi:MAG: EAL domain-containing protein (putative c-di-GMP-specific phosphodiesterase class I) [Paraglaciecola sp.]|jgi:EAL domain-containing protein (putative c-di-GMP-specific phosphodiesterase class I)